MLMNKFINWLAPDFQNMDFLDALNNPSKIIHVRAFLKMVIYSILKSYPWHSRTDLVDLFDPTTEYASKQIVAFLANDSQGLRPTIWHIGIVKKVTMGENPAQGQFQVVTFEVNNHLLKLASNIPNSKLPDIVFSLDDPDDLEWLTSNIVDTYRDSLLAGLNRAIRGGILQASVKGDNIILGAPLESLGDEEKLFLEELVKNRSVSTAWLNSRFITQELIKIGGFNICPTDFALDVVDEYLAHVGYKPLGNHYWITSEKLEEIDREVQSRSHVPIVSSKLAKEYGEQEGLKDYSEFELDEEAKKALTAFGQEEDDEVGINLGEWKPPTSPIQLPTLTYQNIIEAFFSLSNKVIKAFPPHDGQQLIEILVVDNDEKQGCHPFLINRDERIIKAIDKEAVRKRFLDANIPAGTKLWIEYLHDGVYRIYPKPLNSPTTHKCKIAVWGEDNKLSFETYEVPIGFEHESQLFVAEFRHTDPDALFKEAIQIGESIFDALIYSFQELSKFSPNAQVHYLELFNAVFFAHRMCSPRSVITELYSRPCFLSIGDGYFSLDLKKGIHRKYYKKKAGISAGTSLIGILNSLSGKELYTLEQNKKFRIIAIQPTVITIQTSTGEERKIETTRIQGAWDQLIKQGQLSRSEIQEKYSEINTTYIAAILSTFPNVDHTTAPIRLLIKSSQIAKPKGHIPPIHSETPPDYSLDGHDIDPDLVYLLGLAVARGNFNSVGLNITLQVSTLETDVAHQNQTAIIDSIAKLEERLIKRFGQNLQQNSTSSTTEISISSSSPLFPITKSIIGPSGSMTVPQWVFDLPRELKLNFAQGFADAAGFVRRAQYYTDGRIFIFFQIRQSDWFLPTKICTLFQAGLEIPVSFIIWGHPNIRDPQVTSQRASWAKEHQLKVFCDAFEEVGFFLAYKQRAFEYLSEINKGLNKSLPKLCNPENKSITTSKSKPSHPEENSDKLPDQLRGVHCDSWWQVCLNMGCPFARKYNPQSKLWD